MKYLLVAYALLLTITATSQVPAVYAHFPQGIDSEDAYIRHHLIYPEYAWHNNIQGQVKCRYVVSAEGKIKDVQVIKGLSADTDSEAVRVIRSLPDFVPTMFRGVPQQTVSMMNIAFSKPMIAATVDQQPEFPGGQQALVTYLKDSIPYPESSGSLMGRVTFELVVDADGSVIYASTDNSFGSAYQWQIRQFFRSFPRFKPATAGGEKVCTTVTATIDILRRVR